jgi:pseudaminic acid biosynthesis-associated methylase
MTNPQENFWKNEIAMKYSRDNSQFDAKLGQKAWEQMLSKIDKQNISNFLDCGSNIGKNIRLLQAVVPEAIANIIEIAEAPFQICLDNNDIENSFLGSIKDASFSKKFDLVFTEGVLIHINPDDLLESMRSMYALSNRYVLIAEYFNRTPVAIEYRGELDRLFKRDFGKLFLENFECKLLDYGFLWGHEYDSAGFDDITYWLFEKAS